MALEYDYVWVLTTPEGKVIVFKEQSTAEKSIPENFRRLEVAPRKLKFTQGTSVYKLEIQKIRGTAGLT